MDDVSKRTPMEYSREIVDALDAARAEYQVTGDPVLEWKIIADGIAKALVEYGCTPKREKTEIQ